MPYKDKEKRNELTRKHYNKNKASYIKRASIWKANNKDKVKESRVRYSEKKKIIGELNELQISYFKTDRSKDATREFFVTYENELKESLPIIKQEALSFFGSDAVYVEKFIDSPRHIEVQVICDTHGHYLHLHERDCSIQRRNQKVIEEALAPEIDETEKNKLFDICVKAMKKMNYVGLGTLEFLYEKGNFYFMEMNTRLQVEHPITEMLTRIDLVREQICVAAGEKIIFSQENVKPLGHSIECRINAESPMDFKPSAGSIKMYHPPAGNGIRLDTFIYSGYKVPHYYDNLLAKLIVTGRTRNHAIKRALRALNEMIIDGIETNIELHKKILSSKDFKKGAVSIKWLEDNMASL